MSFRRQKQTFQEIAHPPRELATPAFAKKPPESVKQTLTGELPAPDHNATDFGGGIDQRKFPRVEPVAELNCELGSILDISIAGIRLAMKQVRPLKAKQSMMVPLTMREHKILIPAKVVWIKNVSGDNEDATAMMGRSNDKTISLRQEVGFRFTSLAPMLTLPERDLMALGLIPSDDPALTPPKPMSAEDSACVKGQQMMTDVDDLLASHP